jgi:hypothetical protein
VHAAALHAAGAVLREHPGKLLRDADVRLPSVDDLRPAGRTVRRQLRRREQPTSDVRLRVIQFGMSQGAAAGAQRPMLDPRLQRGALASVHMVASLHWGAQAEVIVFVVRSVHV